jgi:ComF family protein
MVVAAEIAQVMTRLLHRPASGLLVPIPLSRKRRRVRGYNQAAAIARALGRQWSLPVAENVVRRLRDTPTQTALAPDARARNVAGAFAAASPPPREAPVPPVILVDDVLTTGATLVAGATALSDAGWTTIGAMTFARALPYDLRVP